jgi:hypothetical protein
MSLQAADGRLAVLRPPSWEFPFGTTHLARPLSQMIEATRTTVTSGSSPAHLDLHRRQHRLDRRLRQPDRPC